MSAQSDTMAGRSDAYRGALPTQGPDALAACWRMFFLFPSVRWLAFLTLLCAGLRIRELSACWMDAALVAGLVMAWPVQEWLIHVFILHFNPTRLGSILIDFPVSKKHRAHHTDPWYLPDVFMPVHVIVLTGPVVALLCNACLATPQALTLLTAYFALALHYEWVHFLVHTRYVPKSAHYKRLWRNHRLHHFKSEHHWFGVTMLTGDRIMGTAPDVASVETSPTARNLGGITS